MKEGDDLRSQDGATTVAAGKRVRGIGLFAPHTLQGDLVVNRAVVSCCTLTVHPRLAHVLLARVRVVVRLGLADELLRGAMYGSRFQYAWFAVMIGGAGRISVRSYTPI
jgi:Hint module